jgi:NAD(P)-dependent dehydrogenase (short-subunit alcohol dehydrogenase family)
VVEEIRTAGGTAVPHVGSVASWDEAEGLVQRSIIEFGRIDGLVNNAGIHALCKPHAAAEPMLRSIIEVNLLGSAFCGVHAIRRMLDQGYGTIVNTVSGAMVGLPFMSAYGASKAGVAALTYSWASDLAGSGVRVNAVSPMAFTRMSDIDTPEGFEGDWLAEKLPFTQVTPEQNAPVVIFLLSDLSAAVHGQVVRIQGEALSLMRKPEIVQPVLHREAWTVEAVAEAFAHELHDVLQPIPTWRPPDLDYCGRTGASVSGLYPWTGPVLPDVQDQAADVVARSVDGRGQVRDGRLVAEVARGEPIEGLALQLEQLALQLRERLELQGSRTARARRCDVRRPRPGAGPPQNANPSAIRGPRSCRARSFPPPKS